MPHHIRIFLSSPGDVSLERTLVREVCERLPNDPLLRETITLEVVAWDKPGAGTPMLATLTPQEAVNQGLPKPSECDVVVVILWSRLGTPLPEEYVKPELYRFPSSTKWADARYLSGTEWEYVDAMQAARGAHIPLVIVYRRTEKILLDPSAADFADKLEQWQHVEGFFKSLQNPDGSIRQGYNAYDTPDAFRAQFEHHLKDLIKRLLEMDTKPSLSRPAAVESLPIWKSSPFPGLRAFTPEDAPIFFGRGRETDALLRHINDRRFVAVVGASGSGKSSLVGAGLIPRLLDNAIPGSKDWLWRHFTPGEVSDNPFSALAVQLAPLVNAHPRELADQLIADPGALCAICERALNDPPEWAELLLFVDQFEELFTVVNPEHRTRFVELLAIAANTERLRTVLTLRADFYHRCVEYEELAELFRDGSFPLAAPKRDALREMVERPALCAGLNLESGLVDRILDDTSDEPGNLALMAYALDELYKLAETRDDHCLTFTDYKALGGVEQAIGTRAEGVFSTLDEAAQEALPHVFRELMVVNLEGTPTRKRTVLNTLATDSHAQRLVEVLTEARLLVQSRGDNYQPVIEVAHEALFRSWPTLRAWIERTKDDLYLLQQVQAAAALWGRNNRNNAFLWPDERLQPVYAMQERLQSVLDDVTRDFIRPEAERLEKTLEDPTLDHAARARIGERLHLIGDTRSGVGLRSDGLPDIIWCYIPIEGETIQKELITDSFYIAKYPITYTQFQAFVDAPNGFMDERWWAQLDNHGKMKNLLGQQFRFSNHPRENISWSQAMAFCRWLTAVLPAKAWPFQANQSNSVIRLPTEHEWLLAASGGEEGRLYPWGNNLLDHKRANTNDAGLRRTTAVGCYPLGASPYGVQDMSGNVWELCLTEYNNSGHFSLSLHSPKVILGGSCQEDINYARLRVRSGKSPLERHGLTGFRIVCARPILNPE